MIPRTTAFVGMGGNLGEPVRAFQAALTELQKHPEIKLSALSSLYRTSPVGYADQADFLNAVARIGTRLAPIELLDELQRIESLLGRVRDGVRFGPRKIDLDLLLYGAEIVDLPRLSVPHPRLHLRRFALQPLEEIDASFQIPGRGAVQQVLSELLVTSDDHDETVERVEENWYESDRCHTQARASDGPRLQTATDRSN